MARKLRNEEFLILQQYVDASDRIGYYTQLSAWGYVYGDLALGVVNNDSTAGKAANIYLKSYGGQGQKPSNDQLAQIGLDLMKADFIARQAYSGSAEGQDLTYDIVQGYHNSVFEANHVDVDAWTPNKALNWLDDPAQKQALWNSLLTDGPILSFASIVAALADVDQPGKSGYLDALTLAGTSAAYSDSNEFGDYSISIPGGGLLVGTGVRNQDLAVGSDQNDVLISFMGNDELRGGEGNDRLYGQDGNDRLIGGGGDDIIVAGSGDDVVYTGYDDGGSGQNHYDSGNDVVFSGDGNDVVYSSGGTDVISLGDGDDEVHLSMVSSSGEKPYSRTVIWGGEGSDSFYFQGRTRVLSIHVDGMSDDLLKNLDTTEFFKAIHDEVETKFDYVLINVDNDDKIFVDGIQLTTGVATESRTSDTRVDFNYYFSYGDSNTGLNYYDANSVHITQTITENDYYQMKGFTNSVDVWGHSYYGLLMSANDLIMQGFSDGVAGIHFIGDGVSGKSITTYTTQAIEVKSYNSTFYNSTSVFNEPTEYTTVGDPLLATGGNEGYQIRPDGYDTSTTPTIDLSQYQIDLGGDENRRFTGTSLQERFRGGAGVDTVDYSNSPNEVHIYPYEEGMGGDAEGDTFVSIENFTGSAFNDILVGAANVANVLEGNAGDDLLVGGFGGGDTLIGGQGSDTYEYSRGYGEITIIDTSSNVSGNSDVDKLVFSAINSDNISVVRNNNDLTLLIAESASGAGDGGSILIKDTLDSNSDAGIEQIVFADGTIWTKTDLVAHSVPSDTSNAATIVGTAGDDHLTGTAGNDIIDSLGGNDYVNGGEGSDTYLYSVNDGDEYIDDESGSMTDADVLKMKDIKYSDVTFSRDSTSNLILTVNSTQHVLTLDEQFYSSSEGWGLEKIQFADGITVDLQHSDAVWTYHGSNGDDHIVGAMWGKDDVFVGGKGNDYLNGAAGSDTYVYSKGDGSDTIYDDAGFTIEEGNTDVLRFTDLNQSDLTFARDGEKLIVAVNGTQDKITVERQFTSTEQDFGVEKIEFADGSSWGLADIWQNIPITGTSANDTLQGSKYNETLVGGDGDDTLIGGLGDDYLEGGLGSDTYRFNFGDGHDTIFDGGSTASTEVDQLVFGTGISSSDVTVAVGTNNSDLLLTVANGGGEIALKNQRIDNSGGVDQISFADGTVWDRSTLLTKAAA